MKKTNRRLAPSLLSADFGCLAEQIDLVLAGGADLLHLDIMDGHFVPDITFGPPVVRSLARSSRLPFDVHLMIERPDALIPEFVTERTEMITVHAEACVHLQRSLQLIRSFGVLAGVALNPATPLTALDYVWDDLDLVLLMSVNPGYCGQTFIPAVADKLRQLDALRKERKPELILAMDGGIHSGNLADLCRDGLDLAVAGSAIFGAADVPAQVKAFREILDR